MQTFFILRLGLASFFIIRTRDRKYTFDEYEKSLTLFQPANSYPPCADNDMTVKLKLLTCVELTMTDRQVDFKSLQTGLGAAKDTCNALLNEGSEGEG